MRTHKWSDDDFILAVKESRSARQALITLGNAPHGGNYATIKRHVKRLNLDTSHWKGRGWSKGNKYKEKSVYEYLALDGPHIATSKLRSRLVRNKILDNKCTECGISKWRDKDLILHLDHINGNSEDNRLWNLRILCPNCHSQTKTYCRQK